MKHLFLMATMLLIFGALNAQTITTSTGDYEVTCTRSWQECKLCGQKKTFVYRVKNYKGDESKTVAHCKNWFLIALTTRLNLQFELGRGLTMIYPEFTEKVYMAPAKCAASPSGTHSFLTKTEDFVDKYTKEEFEGCKNNEEIE
jgi:hypothetical protein